MSNHVIITDSSCDIPPDVLRSQDVSACQLCFTFEGDEYTFIVHGDCMKDAELLENMIRSKVCEITDICIFDVGPVIGSHSCPGTPALFFSQTGVDEYV